jgi:putative flavoprotein involved in K+ transport
VIGAGHAGLAMSRCLSARAIDHVVLERGLVANSWRRERWDSLRLLTPNWQSRLPGFGYEGADPDGYRTMPEVVAFIERYAKVIDAPVRTQTKVTSVRHDDTGYVIDTDREAWHCRSVVVATGACNIASVPDVAEAVPTAIESVTSMDYRNPDQLQVGGVLVVGASATGIQLADEIHRSGRPVTLAVGEHIRAPRVYRGKDIQWWMDAAGILDERYDAINDINRARRVPSLQLVGSDRRTTLDLNALSAIGVRLVGRIAGLRGSTALFSGALRNLCALSDLKMNRLLKAIDDWASQNDLDRQVEQPSRLPPTNVGADPPLQIDLIASGIRSIVWATGYRPDYSWLHVPVLDRKLQIRHEGGVGAIPGLYVMGLQFLRRRKSALIDGAGDDASDLADHLLHYLNGS